MAQHPTSPTWVGEQFISKYYDVLERLPKYLHRFYRENSTFTVTDEQLNGSAAVETASGSLEAIQEKVMATVANAVVAGDKSLDAQFSEGGGVLLQVAGFMKLHGVDRRFVQTFFLATQEKGYYVLNDMLRILAPEPLASQLPPRVDMTPGMAPGMSVAAAPVPVEPVAAEAEPAVQEAAVAAPAPVAAPEPEVVEAPVVAAAPTPVVQAPPVVPAPQQAPVPVPVPAAPAAAPAPVQPKQPAPAAAAPAAPAPPLSWAERAKLASAAKQPVPAKAPQQPAPAAAEAPAAEVSSSTPAAAEAATGAPAEARGDVDSDSRVPEALPAVPLGMDNDPGHGVYVQGIPQTLSEEDLVKLLSAQFAQFGAFGMGGVKIVKSPRFGMVAYVFYQDEKSRDAARESSGKLRLSEAERPLKILGALPEFERGFAQRPGGRGDRGRGSGMGSGYRGGRGGFDGVRGRGGRGEGRGDRPPSGGPGGRGGRGAERGGRGGGPGRGPRDPASGPVVPKQP
ncbi:hypothetical protein Agub_g702 [Astrephomene gubernaculifera]|uniref:NTF2 domain-containing protein n=1 Tax=Astrephomene gubernaculifera TaxID=47775 RepID=A0AAD3HGW5_9CHLO|nr:hypothetical protein Agub_g702 [Astrephomene gubernaculifera]